MKKNFVKQGALAVAVTLTLIFAACAQPVDEAAGADTPTILRVYLDRQALPSIIDDGTDSLLFTVGTLDAEAKELGNMRFINDGVERATDNNG